MSYSAECSGTKFYKTLMLLGQAWTFLPFQARRSSAKRSSTSDLTVVKKKPKEASRGGGGGGGRFLFEFGVSSLLIFRD